MINSYPLELGGRVPPSRRQAELHAYLERRREQGLSPPSYDEMKQELNLKSKKSIDELLDGLERKGFIRRSPGKKRSIELVDPPPRAVRIAVMGDIAAGLGIADESGNTHWGQEPVDWIDLPIELLGRNEASQIRVFHVKGDSMIEAGILDGDRVIVRLQQDAVGGDLVVAGIRDDITDTIPLTVKRFQRKNGHPWLLPANPAYEPIDGAEALIWGKAIGLLRYPLI